MRIILHKPWGRFALLYVIFFAFCSVFAWLNLKIVDEEEVYHRYGAQIDAIAELHKLGGIEAVQSHLEGRLEKSESGKAETHLQPYYRLVTLDGEELIGSIPQWREDFVVRRFGDFVVLDDLPRAEIWQFPSYAYFKWRLNPDYDLLIKEMKLSDRYVMTVGQDLNMIQDVRMASYVLIGVMCALFLGGGLMGGRMIAAAFRRIDGVLVSCNEIIRTGDVSRRIEDRSDGRDPEKLVPTLNAMLERIERSFRSLQLSAANIAHDLKTPLARLRAKVEGLAVDDRSSEECVGGILSETERMGQIFDASMQIALLESGKPLSNKESVAIDHLLRGLLEFYGPIFEEKGLVVKSALVALSLDGDRQLLEQMLSNLLENAAKYVPKNGTVFVETSVSSQGVSIRIGDSGGGIGVEDRDRVFDKFYRGDSSRSSDGNGLGLSIVKAIAHAHGGTVDLRNNHPGLLVEISFDGLGS